MKLRLMLALAAAAVACVAFGGAASAQATRHPGQRYIFNGEVLSAPGANAGSLSVQIEGGNHAALKALIGGAQSQTLALDGSTRVLVYSHGVPHVANTSEIQQGDFVT